MRRGGGGSLLDRLSVPDCYRVVYQPSKAWQATGVVAAELGGGGGGGRGRRRVGGEGVTGRGKKAEGGGRGMGGVVVVLDRSLFDCYLPSLVELVIVSVRKRRGMITDRAFPPMAPQCCACQALCDLGVGWWEVVVVGRGGVVGTGARRVGGGWGAPNTDGRPGSLIRPPTIYTS